MVDSLTETLELSFRETQNQVIPQLFQLQSSTSGRYPDSSFSPYESSYPSSYRDLDPYNIEISSNSWNGKVIHKPILNLIFSATNAIQRQRSHRWIRRRKENEKEQNEDILTSCDPPPNLLQNILSEILNKFIVLQILWITNIM